jgi:nucleoside-diphosphate-sugar epimerase
MKNILVTGAAGFLGSYLVKDLFEKGFNITSLILPSDDPIYIKKFSKIIVGNILEPITFEDKVEDIDTIIHCAGLTPGYKSRREDYFRVNVKGTEQLLDFGKRKKINRFILVSSCSIFGITSEKRSVFEDSPVNPDSFYAKSKVEAEHLCEQYLNFIPNITIVRPTIIYGPRMPKLSGAYTVFKIATSKLSITINNLDGLFEFCHVSDVSNGIIKTLNQPNFQIFNITNTTKHTYSEIIEEIKRQSKIKSLNIKLPFKVAKTFALIGDLSVKVRKKKFLFSSRSLDSIGSKTYFNGNKLESIGYRAEYSLTEGIKNTLEN